MDDGLETLLKLLIMVGGLVFFCGGIFSARNSFLIHLRKGLATGRIVKTRFIRRRGSDSDREAYVLIAFETPDQRVVRFEQSAPGGFFTVHSAESVRSLEGRDVVVHYDRKNPDRASITPMRDYYWGILFAIAGAFIFLGVTIFWNEISFPL